MTESQRISSAYSPRMPKPAEFKRDGNCLAYTVKAGDTLSRISRSLKDLKVYISPAELAALQQPKITNPDLILPGQKIIIPCSALTAGVQPEAEQVKTGERVQGQKPAQKDVKTQSVKSTDILEMAKYDKGLKFTSHGRGLLIADAEVALANKNPARALEIAKVFAGSSNGECQRIAADISRKAGQYDQAIAAYKGIQTWIKGNPGATAPKETVSHSGFTPGSGKIELTQSQIAEVRIKQCEFMNAAKGKITNPFDHKQVVAYFKSLPSNEARIGQLKNYLAAFYFHPGGDISDNYSVKDMLGKNGNFSPDSLGRKPCDCKLFAELTRDILGPAGYKFEDVKGVNITLKNLDRVIGDTIRDQSLTDKACNIMKAFGLIERVVDEETPTTLKLVRTDNFNQLSEKDFKALFRANGIDTRTLDDRKLATLYHNIKSSYSSHDNHLMLMLNSPDGKSYILNNEKIDSTQNSSSGSILASITSTTPDNRPFTHIKLARSKDQLYKLNPGLKAAPLRASIKSEPAKQG